MLRAYEPNRVLLAVEPEGVADSPASTVLATPRLLRTRRASSSPATMPSTDAGGGGGAGGSGIFGVLGEENNAPITYPLW